MLIFKGLGTWARAQERKQLKKPANLSRIDKMFEEINEQNSEVKIKRKFIFKAIFFFEGIFSFEFFMSYFLGIQMDILISAFVGIKYGKFDSFANIFSVILSILVVGFYALVTVLISIKVWVFSRREKDKIEELHKHSVNKKWDFLEIGIKKELPFA